MAQFASDLYAGTSGTELNAYSSVWSKQTGVGINSVITPGERARTSDGFNVCVYQHSGAPANANYSVKCDLYKVNTVAYYLGPIARASTSATTFYMVRNALAANNQLFKCIAGSYTQLGADAAAVLALDVNTNLKLETIGTAIKVYWDNSATAMISQTDGDITAAGKAGFWIYSGVGEGNFTGVHLDNFSADDASGAAALAGTASGVATAAGALTTAIRLLGNASGIATASGSLLDPIPLAGSAVSVANATGAITAQISLSGAAIALAAAFGNITAQITLAGNAQDVATAVGDLTAFGSGLSGAAQGLASGSGVLTAQIKLAANAAAIATAVGGMTTGIPLSGAMVAISSATGALTISVVLSGAAVAQAIASGALTAQINLSGAALGVAIAAAYLGTSAALNGAAASIALAAGVLENYIDAVTLVSAYSSNVGLVSTPDSVALRHYH